MPDRDCQLAALRGGALVGLRPIAPEDKPLLLGIFQRLSGDSRYRRFSMRLRELSPAMLADFTEVDHSDREAIIAIGPSSGEALGVARYVRLSDHPENAEVAVAVVDDWQGRGLAPVLLAELSRVAQQEGVERFIAFVQTDNHNALALFAGVANSERELVGQNFQLVVELHPGMNWSGKHRKPVS
jgi:acetyltransferase